MKMKISYTVSQSKPINAVDAYRLALIAELERQESSLKNLVVNCKTQRESARRGGELSQLQGTLSLLRSIKIQ